MQPLKTHQFPNSNIPILKNICSLHSTSQNFSKRAKLKRECQIQVAVQEVGNGKHFKENLRKLAILDNLVLNNPLTGDTG